MRSALFICCAMTLAQALGAVSLTSTGGHIGAALTQPASELQSIQQLLDQGQGEAALQALEPLLRKRPRNAEALLARSTAYFLTDQFESGIRDLERSLTLDPSLRQGWLNLGALRLSEGNGQAALEAFLKARELDPTAIDNSLNVGTVRLMLGDVDAARTEFAEYLRAEQDSAQANVLIAKNYALAHVIEDATRHAAAAITKNERLRLQMRRDPAFSLALDDPDFQLLLQQDVFRPANGSLIAAKTFDTAYDAATQNVTGAVIDSLTKLGIAFDPRVEATANWALLWGERLRIKIEPAGPVSASSTVTLVAEPRSMTRKSWQDLQDRLFGQIGFELAPKLPDLPRRP